MAAKEKRGWTLDAWGAYEQITVPHDPVEPMTSLLTRVRNGFMADRRWEPIRSELEEILNQAAEEAAQAYDIRKGPLEPFFWQAAVWRAQDALNKKFQDCPACKGNSQPRDANASGVSICPACKGRGRVLLALAVETADINAPPGAKAVESTTATKWEQCLFDELETRLEERWPDWMPRPPDPDFIRDFVDSVQGLSPSNQMQMLLDEQLFASEPGRTSSYELRTLCEWLGMTAEAIRAARLRIRKALREVFLRHGSAVPESLLEWKAGNKEGKAERERETDNPALPRSTVSKNKPFPRSRREG